MGDATQNKVNKKNIHLHSLFTFSKNSWSSRSVCPLSAYPIHRSSPRSQGASAACTARKFLARYPARLFALPPPGRPSIPPSATGAAGALASADAPRGRIMRERRTGPGPYRRCARVRAGRQRRFMGARPLSQCALSTRAIYKAPRLLSRRDTEKERGARGLCNDPPPAGPEKGRQDRWE